MKFLKKLIPIEIKIKSLYWKEKEDQIENDLKNIFNLLDNDDYDDVEKLISQFRLKWENNAETYPLWLYEKIAQISKAQAMFDFLNPNSLEEEKPEQELKKIIEKYSDEMPFINPSDYVQFIEKAAFEAYYLGKDGKNG